MKSLVAVTNLLAKDHSTAARASVGLTRPAGCNDRKRGYDDHEKDEERVWQAFHGLMVGAPSLS